MKQHNKTLSKKCKQFQQNFFRSIEYTIDFINENPDFQYYLLWIFFNNSLFNKTTNPFLDQHLRENYNEIEKEDIFDFYLTVMNKKRLLQAVEDFVTGNGGARFKKVLKEINQSWETEKYVAI